MDSFIRALSLTKDEWKEDRVFIAKEVEHGGSLFYQLSNKGEIGVLSKSELKGQALLFLLKLHLDKIDLKKALERLQKIEYDDGTIEDRENPLTDKELLEGMGEEEYKSTIYDDDDIDIYNDSLDKDNKLVTKELVKKKSDIHLYRKADVLELFQK